MQCEYEPVQLKVQIIKQSDPSSLNSIVSDANFE